MGRLLTQDGRLATIVQAIDGRLASSSCEQDCCGEPPPPPDPCDYAPCAVSDPGCDSQTGGYACWNGSPQACVQWRQRWRSSGDVNSCYEDPFGALWLGYQWQHDATAIVGVGELGDCSGFAEVARDIFVDSVEFTPISDRDGDGVPDCGFATMLDQDVTYVAIDYRRRDRNTADGLYCSLYGFGADRCSHFGAAFVRDATLLAVRFRSEQFLFFEQQSVRCALGGGCELVVTGMRVEVGAAVAHNPDTGQFGGVVGAFVTIPLIGSTVRSVSSRVLGIETAPHPDGRRPVAGMQRHARTGFLRGFRLGIFSEQGSPEGSAIDYARIIDDEMTFEFPNLCVCA